MDAKFEIETEYLKVLELTRYASMISVICQVLKYLCISYVQYRIIDIK